ncbi:CotH kinase family protein, partial [Promineifilum sp.]|uniref:CotH kinase family protein n=1 Tax=Promineifilum sp. TaxID=2664178 RepID=UPI0035B2214F
LVDSVTLAAQKPDLSYGRASGGGWAYFDPPTPGAANNTPAFASYVNNYAAAPVFSEPGGRYAGTRLLQLSTTEPGGVIRYTLDGSRPTPNSAAYSTPIAVSAPTVVRARTFAPERISSPTVSHTYLINVPAHLPAVSIATDPAHLFDNTIGIYVVGTNGVKHCSKKANWNQPWLRPASIEVYDTAGTRLAGQDVGIEIHGNCTRSYNMKSFEIKARKVYGDNDIDYAFFAGDKPMTSYKRLILRTGGQDVRNTLLRDALSSQLLLGRMDIDRSAYRPAVLYINGQFWGIYGLREKIDEDYVENNYGLDEEFDFDALEEQADVLAGNADRWNAFYNYVKTHDPADPAVYAYVKTQMDVEEFINYQIAEIYAANTDWPHFNIRYWRGYAPGSRWRWLLYDMDAGFSNTMARGYNHNTLKLAMSRTGKRAYGSLLMVQLSRNAEFRALFAQRFAAHLNTTFAPARVTALIDSMAGAIAPDIPAQAARWKMPRNVATWQTEVNKLRTFAQKRPDPVRGHVNAYLGAPGLTTLTVVAGAGGNVQVAGVAVPDQYSGLHYLHTPMTLRATPDPGELFVRWQETGQTTAEITVTLNGPATYTAVFEAEPPPPPLPALVINELHYRPAAPQTEAANEFIEIYNADAAPADLSGYTIEAVSFTFPAGATIAPGDYIVVAAESADPAYAALPAGNVFDWVWGSLDNQKLSNSSEMVALKHPDGRAADSVVYGDGTMDGTTPDPWPAAPDGGGPTLALLDSTFDNTLFSSWAASREAGGTPGAANFPPLPPPPPVVINEIHYNPA